MVKFMLYKSKKLNILSIYGCHIIRYRSTAWLGFRESSETAVGWRKIMGFPLMVIIVIYILTPQLSEDVVKVVSFQLDIHYLILLVE